MSEGGARAEVSGEAVTAAARDVAGSGRWARQTYAARARGDPFLQKNSGGVFFGFFLVKWPQTKQPKS